MADTVAKRSEIPQEKRWAVEDLYPCDAAWEEDYQRVAALIGEGEKYKGHLGDSAQTLQEYLDFADQLDQEIEKIYMYAHLNMDVDTTDVTYQTMRMKAQTLLVRAEEENAFAAGDHGHSGRDAGFLAGRNAGALRLRPVLYGAFAQEGTHPQPRGGRTSGRRVGDGVGALRYVYDAQQRGPDLPEDRR